MSMYCFLGQHLLILLTRKQSCLCHQYQYPSDSDNVLLYIVEKRFLSGVLIISLREIFLKDPWQIL